MQPNIACAGQCIVEQFKLQYQIVNLQYIVGKSISIEAVAYNPYSSPDKEAVLKFSTTNLNSPDKRLDIAMSMVDDVIANLGLDADKLRKLIVRDSQAFWVCSV